MRKCRRIGSLPSTAGTCGATSRASAFSSQPESVPVADERATRGCKSGVSVDQPRMARRHEGVDGVDAAGDVPQFLGKAPPPLGEIRRAGFYEPPVARQAERVREEDLGDGLRAQDAALQHVLLAEGEAHAQELLLAEGVLGRPAL